MGGCYCLEHNIQLELVTVVISENMSVRREQSRSVTWSVLIIILVSASKSQSKTFKSLVNLDTVIMTNTCSYSIQL